MAPTVSSSRPWNFPLERLIHTGIRPCMSACLEAHAQLALYHTAVSGRAYVQAESLAGLAQMLQHQESSLCSACSAHAVPREPQMSGPLQGLVGGKAGQAHAHGRHRLPDPAGSSSPCQPASPW